MTETHIGFLHNAASSIPSGNNQTASIIKSYFLMRCKEITKGHNLPEKHFSPNMRCTHCCLEWSRGTIVKLNSSKLTRRQKKRIRNQKESNKQVKNKKELLNSKTLEISCPFCKKTTKIINKKPEKASKNIIKKTVDTKIQAHKQKLESKKLKEIQKKNELNVYSKMKEIQKKNELNNYSKMKEIQKKNELNVYSKTNEVFSLKNKNNTIATKEKCKVINNKKSKKNKFAGLCQKAVLSAAKYKEEGKSKNKLSLFLKPST